MIKATLVILVQPTIVSQNNERGLDEPGFDSVIQTESLTIQLNRASSLLLPPDGAKGVCGKIEALQNSPRTVNTIQTSYPLGGFINVRPIHSLTLTSGLIRHACGGFVIDHQQIATLCHFTQYTTNPRFITLCAAFITPRTDDGICSSVSHPSCASYERALSPDATCHTNRSELFETHRNSFPASQG